MDGVQCLKLSGLTLQVEIANFYPGDLWVRQGSPTRPLIGSKGSILVIQPDDQCEWSPGGKMCLKNQLIINFKAADFRLPGQIIGVPASRVHV